MRQYLYGQKSLFLFHFLFLFATAFTLFPVEKCFSISNSGYSYQIPARINDGWATGSMYETNIDAKKLVELIYNIRNNSYKNIHSILIVKDGILILEEYFHGFHYQQSHQIRSTTKSIGSILTGIAIDHQFIKDINQKIYPYFKDYKIVQDWNEEVKDVTLKTLLTMTSGFACDDHLIPNFQCEKAMYKTNDWLEYALNLPMAYKPGEHWAYNSSSLIVVSEIISKTSKLTITEFADKYLFKPLGINEFQWGFSPKGRAFFGGNAKMKPRDMGKIGLIMLNRGKWNDRQIISERWIKESTSEHVQSQNSTGYGYLWWTGKQTFGEQNISAYWAAGNGGNYVFVCPALSLVAVFTGGNYNNILEIQPLGILINYIIPAMLPPVPLQQNKKLDSSFLDSCVGEYQLQSGHIRLSVFKKDDELYCKVLGKISRMYAEKKNKFFVPDEVFGNWTLEIKRNEKGDVTSAIGYAAFQVMPFKKIIGQSSYNKMFHQIPKAGTFIVHMKSFHS